MDTAGGGILNVPSLEAKSDYMHLLYIFFKSRTGPIDTQGQI